MSEALLEPAEGTGRFRVRGDLSFDTVPGLWAQSERLFRSADRVELDLGEVGRTDSAGLALLVALTRRARERGQGIHYSHFPEQLLAMARLSGLSDVLALDGEPA